MVRGKPGEAFRELVEEFLFPVEVRRVAAPVGRSRSPMSGPVEGGGIGLFPEVAVLQGGLPGLAPEVVRDLVLEDADQPGRLGGISGKGAAVLQRREKGLLDEVLRRGAVP